MRQAIAVQNLNMINRHSRNEISGCVFLPDMQFRIRVKGGTVPYSVCSLRFLLGVVPYISLNILENAL